MRGYLRPTSSSISDDILGEQAFAEYVVQLCERASRRAELVAVIAVRVDDLEQISTAFGSEVARAVSETWRSGVRMHAPTNAMVADDGPTGLLVGALTDSPRDARRIAGAIYRGLFQDLGRVGGGVIPVVGVGVGLSDTAGYDAAELIRIARDAAILAAETVDTSVVIAEAE
jgi:GGDEF domain-containing protein